MNSRILIGVAFIVLGILFFLQQIGFMDVSVGQIIGDWWPLVFVYIGFKDFKQKNKITNSSIIFTVLGVLLIAYNIFDIEFWSIAFPVALIAIGINVIFNSNKHKIKSDNPFVSEDFGSNFESKQINEDYLTLSGIFSGSKHLLDAKNLKGGEITSVFGSLKVDLRNCTLANDFQGFNATVSFGEVILIVPEDWIIEMIGTPIFGEVKNVTKPVVEFSEANKIVRITYTLTFGSIKVRNW
jgi:predicted membrane protein